MLRFLHPTCVKHLVTLILALGAADAFASGPWDGSWFRDAKRSHVPEVIQLSLAPDGTWTFFDGFTDERFVADGKLHRNGLSASEIRASQPDPHSLLIVKGIHGREYATEAMSLSGDQMTLTRNFQRLDWDGQQRQSSKSYRRATSGNSLQGLWNPAPVTDGSDAATVQQPVTRPAPQPSWVIWTGSDGTMTWFIPRTGEVLRGKADMQPRLIAGPYYDGETFTWKQTSLDRLEFTAYIDGRPVEYAVETVSRDGQTWTDTLWAPGHENTKSVSIFQRHP